MAHRKVIKFCTPVGYINPSNHMTYHPQKLHVYGHVTILILCWLLWCSLSHGLISNSWATCYLL